MQNLSHKQWKIAWCKSKKGFSADFIGIVVLLVYLNIMGISINRQQLSKVKQPYIPFEHVLKTNFLLQEQVSQLTAALTLAHSQVESYKSRISEHQVAIDQQRAFMKKTIEDYDMLKETIATLTDTVKEVA